jgi:hypothetical protein
MGCQGSYYDQTFTIIFFLKITAHLQMPYTHMERPGGDGKSDHWYFFVLIGKDQIMMGKTHMNWWEGPLALFALIGKDQIVMGKAHMHLWEGILICFILTGKDQMAVGKTKW